MRHPSGSYLLELRFRTFGKGDSKKAILHKDCRRIGQVIYIVLDQMSQNGATDPVGTQELAGQLHALQGVREEHDGREDPA